MDSLTSPNMESLHNLVPRYVEQVQKNMTSGCTAYNPYYEPPYQYDPSIVAGIIFCVCFFVGALAHYIITVWKRKWFYVSFALGATGELIGWVARTMAHACPYNSTIFSVQISVLILAPCFLSAGIYYSLGQLIKLWDGRHSPLSQKWYLGIFITGDLISIIIQAAGGVLASHEVNNGDSTTVGSDVMLLGIIVQLVSMGIFAVLWVLVIKRASKTEKTFYPLRPFIISTTIATLLIVARNIYRCVELALGWKGYLNRTEVFFCVFDAAFMTIAVLMLAWWHPARYIPKDYNENSIEKQKLPSGSDIEINNGYYYGQRANYENAQGAYANYGGANAWQAQRPTGNANIGQPMGQPNHMYASQYGR